MTFRPLSSLFGIALAWFASHCSNGVPVVNAFAPHQLNSRLNVVRLFQSTSETTAVSFIDTELRGAAMRLHTREQAPKEGQAPSKEPPKEPYVTTHADYLRFLVDSQHVYQAFEDIVNESEELAVFRNTGLERTEPLEKDIEFMKAEYNLEQPAVGKAGKEYAELLRKIESVPEFVCHFYNFYFAHTVRTTKLVARRYDMFLSDKCDLQYLLCNDAGRRTHDR